MLGASCVDAVKSPSFEEPLASQNFQEDRGNGDKMVAQGLDRERIREMVKEVSKATLEMAGNNDFTSGSRCYC